MYVTDSRGSVYAVDAADGHLLWTYDVTNLIGGGAREGYVFRNRGVCYAERRGLHGRRARSCSRSTRRPASRFRGFGNNGQASVILDVLKTRYPGRQDGHQPRATGSRRRRRCYNGVLYIGSTRSESHIPGGHVLAVDAKTGKVLWHFNTIPQDEKDQGWEIAGPTWVGGERNGGGIWETPSIDPELGLLYVAVGNPFGDSTKRAGHRTSSPIRSSRSTLDTGQARSGTSSRRTTTSGTTTRAVQPILFDMQVRGQRVKALAEASKNGYLYILNRETGQPVHPIKETPVPTETARPGEQPWPTQPIPLHGSGQADERRCRPVFPVDIPPERLATVKLVPHLHAAGPESDQRARHAAAARTTARSPTARGPGCST